MDARLVLLLLTALLAQGNPILKTGAFTKSSPRKLLSGCLSNNCGRPADKNERRSETCLISEGFDQPEEFNLIDEPLILTSAFACCDSCNQNSLCKSWVWIQDGFECWLKNNYKPELNTIPCKSCVSYSASGNVYVSEAIAVKTTSIGGGFGLTEAAIAKAETANKKRSKTPPYVMQSEAMEIKPSEPEYSITYVGSDLPGHDLLDKPISAENYTACQETCWETPDCIGWAWNSLTFACHLKKEWVQDEMVDCKECFCGYKSVWQAPDTPVSLPVGEPQQEPLEIEPSWTYPYEAQAPSPTIQLSLTHPNRRYSVA